MTTAVRSEHQIDVEDIEYRQAKQPLLARVYKPRGAGPFPLVVEVHGGAWCKGSRLNEAHSNEALAKTGVTVVAVDFRLPPEASYPGSLADINYAIRWLKQRAGEFKSRPTTIGVMGSSSGGHQAMLTAMRPRDERYAALPLAKAAADVDASVRCVILCSPVIDPLGRYEYAKKLKADGPPYHPHVDTWIPAHDEYWATEAAMAEGSPVRMLERGEKVELPPVLYVQGTRDGAHPRPNLDRFVASYRKAGGRVDLQLFEGEGEGFIIRNADSPAAAQARDKIAEFVHAELGQG